MLDEPQDNAIEAKGPDISLAIYGGILEYDGAGHYPGLELLNLVYGSADEKLLPKSEKIYVKRNALDFARKLVWDDHFFSHPARREVLLDDHTELTLKHLLECLQLEIPNSSKRPGWDRAHFFPYTHSLIHFDARRSKGTKEAAHKVGIERRYLRGGGALAYKVLRLDPDLERLARCRKGFENLFAGSENSPLDRLVTTLSAHSHKDGTAALDQVEERSRVFDDDLDDMYRNGVDRILRHVDLSTVTRVKALVNWTAIWLAVMQMVRSSRYMKPDETPLPLIFDCGAGHAQLRRASQRCLKDNLSLISEAVEQSRVAVFGENSKLSKKRRDNIRGFFWATAATAQMLNAWRGRRHFTLGLNAMETLVLAGLEPGTQQTFEKFVHEWLYEKCRLLIGRAGAADSGFLSSFDASIFEDNEASLVEQMAAAGLLTQYSDATKMVSVEAVQ